MKRSSGISLLLQMHTEALKLICFFGKADEKGIAVVNNAILFIFRNRPEKGFLRNRITKKFIVKEQGNKAVYCQGPGEQGLYFRGTKGRRRYAQA